MGVQEDSDTNSSLLQENTGQALLPLLLQPQELFTMDLAYMTSQL